jgi:hypothetical protein
MRPTMVVIVAPRFDGCARLGQTQEYMLVETFVAKRLLNDSTKAFCTGLPGAI